MFGEEIPELCPIFSLFSEGAPSQSVEFELIPDPYHKVGSMAELVATIEPENSASRTEAGDSKAWKSYLPTEPMYVGGRGALRFEVVSGQLNVNIFRNSLSKSQYIITRKKDLRHFIEFTHSLLEPDAEHFRMRHERMTS